MNLNQAAHGDREFGYIQTRLGVPRKTVVGHVSNPRRAAAGRGLAARRGRAGRHPARLKLARFGDNMRYVAVTEGDKTEAELRFGVQVNTWGVNELADAVARGIRRRGRRARRRVRGALRRRRPSCAAAATATSRCATAPRSSSGLRSFLEEGGFGAFTTSFEDLGALQAAARPRRAAAHGRGLRLRRRGRLEDRDPRARRERDGRRPARRREPHGGLHLRPRRPATSASSARTCSRSRRRSRPRSRRLEVHPLGIGGKEDPVRLVFTADPGPAARRRDERHARPVPPRRRTSSRTSSAPDLPNLPVGRAVWKPAPDFAHERRRAGSPPAPRTTRS